MAPRILAALAAIALAAGPAGADPDRPARRSEPKKRSTPPASTQKPAPVTPDSQPPPMPDLFPQAVLEEHAARSHPLSIPTVQSRRERRETPAIPLGDDREWLVQAAQVAGMTTAFAVLAILCHDGACNPP